MNESLRNVVAHCTSSIISQPMRPLFVGIAGDSGSGKSYLTDLIKVELENNSLTCNVINHDEFLISRADREPMKKIYYSDGEFKGKSHWEILENMFRLNEFRHVISGLKQDKCVEYHAYSRATGDVSKDLTNVCPSDIILFDTSMMLEYMDFVILVDVTQENIIKRKIIRDADVRTAEEIVDMHKRVQGYYWERGRPKHADIVIDNNDFSNVHIVSG